MQHLSNEFVRSSSYQCERDRPQRKSALTRAATVDIRNGHSLPPLLPRIVSTPMDVSKTRVSYLPYLTTCRMINYFLCLIFNIEWPLILQNQPNLNTKAKYKKLHPNYPNNIISSFYHKNNDQNRYLSNNVSIQRSFEITENRDYNYEGRTYSFRSQIQKCRQKDVQQTQQTLSRSINQHKINQKDSLWFGISLPSRWRPRTVKRTHFHVSLLGHRGHSSQSIYPPSNFTGRKKHLSTSPTHNIFRDGQNRSWFDLPLRRHQCKGDVCAELLYRNVG